MLGMSRAVSARGHRSRELLAVLTITIAVAAGCTPEIKDKVAPIGGSCLGCHNGITDVHPYFALACIDCHGGNDKVNLPAQLNIRDSALLAASHVRPLDSTLWWPNGIDDNNNGVVDEPGEFFDGRLIVEGGATRAQWDSEINSDMNYLRFINPGDLRVADASCGRNNRNSNEAMVCHASVVYDIRRSMMTNNSGVPSGANYGNAQLPLAKNFPEIQGNAAVAAEFDARDFRIGRVGYTMNYDQLDAAFSKEDNSFGIVNNPNDDPNDDDIKGSNGAFQAVAAVLFDDGSDQDDAPTGVGTTRLGFPVKFANRAVPSLAPFSFNLTRPFPEPGLILELRVKKILGLDPLIPQITSLIKGKEGQPITNPVDAALRNFRAYHHLNFPGTNDNFGFVDFTQGPNAGDAPPPDPNDVELVNKNNPFARMRPSGCTGCHIAYRKDGKNEETVDVTVSGNGRQPETALPFGIRNDLGERGYAQKHEIKRAVQLETCASCHGFVTRIDYAYTGIYENEADLGRLEQVAIIGDFNFTTAQGTTVRTFDNLARFKNGALLNAGEGVSEDKNNNGKLDEDEDTGNGQLDPGEDLNGNGRLDPGEDTKPNGFLDIPDRVARSDSFDGRQSRIVYGGGSGAIRLQDIHFERGMACTDCHTEQDIHGDSNIYTRNWDAVEVECDDCHGTPKTVAPLITSGPNGGSSMAALETPFKKPWFESVDGQIHQNSRVTPGKFFVVPQLKDEQAAGATSLAFYAHNQVLETADEAIDGLGRVNGANAHIAEPGQKGGLECYACHSSWQPNCLTCHLKQDVAKPKEEIWLNNTDTEDIFFQLFSFTRSPFYMGVNGDVEGNKISPFRSTMQLHLTIVAANKTLVDNAMFATADNLSSQSSNPNFPHTVRTTETKGCARCHTLVDNNDNVENDHFISEAQGEGTGRYENVADFAVLATGAGLEQIEMKKEAAATPNVSFPGFEFSDVNPRKSVPVNVGAANDVVLVRGVSPKPGDSDIADIAVIASAQGLSFIDTTGRDNAGFPPLNLFTFDLFGAALSVDNIDAAASQSHQVVMVSADKLAVVDFSKLLGGDFAGRKIDPVNGFAGGIDPIVIDQLNDLVVGSIDHNLQGVTRVRQHGRFAFVTHAAGLTMFDLGERDPADPVLIDSGVPIADPVAEFDAPGARDVVLRGRFAFVATGAGGVRVFDIGAEMYGLAATPANPLVATIDADILKITPNSRGVTIFGSRLVIADGVNGVHVVDVSTPAKPFREQTIKVASGTPINQANAVVMTEVPVRSYVLVADGTNGLRVLNVTPVVDYRDELKNQANGAAKDNALRLSFERQDALTPFDPGNVVRQTFTFATAGSLQAIARGLSLDQVADPSGRRLRDNWSIGSTTLNERTIKRMRDVKVKEVAGTVDTRGDGLGCVVRDTDFGAGDGICAGSVVP